MVARFRAIANLVLGIALLEQLCKSLRLEFLLEEADDLGACTSCLIGTWGRSMRLSKSLTSEKS